MEFQSKKGIFTWAKDKALVPLVQGKAVTARNGFGHIEKNEEKGIILLSAMKTQGTKTFSRSVTINKAIQRKKNTRNFV